jgi:hypothetical protein
MTGCNCSCALSNHHFSSHTASESGAVVNWLMCHDHEECRIELGDNAAAQAWFAAAGEEVHIAS